MVCRTSQVTWAVVTPILHAILAERVRNVDDYNTVVHGYDKDAVPFCLAASSQPPLINPVQISRPLHRDSALTFLALAGNRL